MKRIIIICEGQTEQEFCNDVLQTHFFQKNISIQSPVIKKTHGGIASWGELRKQINNHLKQEKEVYVTTLIDYYGIHAKHDYPMWSESKKENDKYKRMDLLENAMFEGIETKNRNRFIPYIQLHEFEGLLFSDIEIIKNNFDDNEIQDVVYLHTTISEFENPEMINDGRETAPSKRLNKIIKGYGKKKSVYGSILASEIGLDTIRSKCNRFNNWIEKLENI